MQAALAIVEDLLLEPPCAELRGTEDMYIPTTQVRILPGGEWHRRGPIKTETACGEEYFACATREYELTGRLCRHCFTPRELALAKTCLPTFTDPDHF